MKEFLERSRDMLRKVAADSPPGEPVKLFVWQVTLDEVDYYWTPTGRWDDSAWCAAVFTVADVARWTGNPLLGPAGAFIELVFGEWREECTYTVMHIPKTARFASDRFKPKQQRGTKYRLKPGRTP